MTREEYIEQLEELIQENEELAYGSDYEIIYKIDDIVIYGGFCDGIRGYDHNELLVGDVTWDEILSWGTIVVPESATYISDTVNFDFEDLGYSRLPLDDNPIVGSRSE